MMTVPLQLIACLLAGALITPALAPFNVSGLALLPPALLYLLSRQQPTNKAPWLGWFFGLGFFGSGVSWVFVSISEHSQTPLLIAIALTALFVMALALLFSLQLYLWKRFFSGSIAWLSFIGIWLLFEWLRSWLFTGFPWLYIGYATLDTPLSSLFPIGGVWLASLATLFISLCLAEGVSQRKLSLLMLAPVPVLIALTIPAHWTTADEKPLKVTLIQPNIPQRIKWDSNYRPEIFYTYKNLSLKNLDTELMLWPETAIPALFQHAAKDLNPLLDQLDQQGVTLISGLPSMTTDPTQPKGYRLHNSVAALTNGSGIYHKQRLVPFGEYLPLENYLRGLLDFFNLPMSSFSLPNKQQKSINIRGVNIAIAICYEIAYPELVRSSSKHSGLLLTVSNDTWFGHSIAPAQHMQIAQARALENGRWLMRGTNNGITAIVDPQGNVIKQLPQYQQGALTAEVYAMQGMTPYQQYGVIPSLVTALLMALAGFRARKTTTTAEKYV